MLEPYAWKQARTVLRELGGSDAARLPGYAILWRVKLKCIRTLAFFICISLLAGCSTKYPLVEERLSSSKITKEQLEQIKRILENRGYEKITRDNYPYEGAYVTQLYKKVNIPVLNKNNKVQVFMSYKTDDASYHIYRNYGFRVFHRHHRDIEEINREIKEVDNIIYNKLVEFVGKSNVRKR